MKRQLNVLQASSPLINKVFISIVKSYRRFKYFQWTEMDILSFTVSQLSVMKLDKQTKDKQRQNKNCELILNTSVYYIQL